MLSILGGHNVTGRFFRWRHIVFAERYGLKFQTLFRRNSVFKTLAALARAVSRRAFTAEAQVRFQFSPCEIRGGQSDTGTRYTPSTSVFLRQYHSTNVSCSSSSACCPYLKDKRKSLWTFQKQVMFQKSGSNEYKNIFIPTVMSWLRWLFADFKW
jgi:hypothetical protein